MSSPETRPRRARRFLGPIAAILLAGLAAGCFQPMYGERSLTGGPGLKQAMARVDVGQIEAVPGTALARLAVEVRNELLFGLTGGGGGAPPTHRLAITLTATTSSLIVDKSTARPEYEIVGMEAAFKLTEVGTGKQVMDGTASARASYDIPGQQQRFAMMRGQRDAQSRAAKVIAEQIRTRVASYLTTGT